MSFFKFNERENPKNRFNTNKKQQNDVVYKVGIEPF